MTENLEEFILENIQLSRLISTLFSPSYSSEFKVQFNQRVNRNIEEDINQSIVQLCDWLLERSNRTIQQLDKTLSTSSLHLKEKTQNVDLDFSRSRQQILHQLQSQSSNVISLNDKKNSKILRFIQVLYKKNTSTASQADELSASIRSTMYGTAAIEVGAVGFGRFNEDFLFNFYSFDLL